MAQQPTYFATEADFRRWLEANHETAPELLVGFWKKGSGKPSIDWPQARDQALCFGWIDGVRKSLGEEAYTIRFTPRRKGSIWSKVNVERFEALKAEGQMTPAGERAYEENKRKSGLYAYEKPLAALAAEDEALFRRNKTPGPTGRRPPGYRKVVLHWVTSAKKPETRAKRLAILIESAPPAKSPATTSARRSDHRHRAPVAVDRRGRQLALHHPARRGSLEIRAHKVLNPRGFGSVRVEATIGDVTWRTSVFPQKSGRLFPSGQSRSAQRAGIAAGDEVRVELELL